MTHTVKLTSPARVRELLEKSNIRPSRALGQNFLVDANVLRIIAQAADLSDGDSVLEIGGGLGALTELLVSTAGRVVCVEKDFKLHNLLEQRFAGCGNLDILRADMTELTEADFYNTRPNKIVANLPYSVGSRILADVFTWIERPVLIVVTVQRDVAERITACDGGAYGLLSIWAQACYEITNIKTISPTCFFPAPKIQSSVLKMARRDHTPEPAIMALLMKLTKFAFSRRRKQISAIAAELPGELSEFRESTIKALKKNNIPAKARPEQISVKKWLALVESLCQTLPDGSRDVPCSGTGKRHSQKSKVEGAGN